MFALESELEGTQYLGGRKMDRLYSTIERDYERKCTVMCILITVPFQMRALYHFVLGSQRQLLPAVWAWVAQAVASPHTAASSTPVPDEFVRTCISNVYSDCI